MAWRVELTKRVLRELDDIFDEIHAVYSQGASEWFTRLEETILLLAHSPRMGKVAAYDRSVREVIYGSKPHFYRVIYELDTVGRRVVVLSIRHGRRLPPSE